MLPKDAYPWAISELYATGFHNGFQKAKEETMQEYYKSKQFVEDAELYCREAGWQEPS